MTETLEKASFFYKIFLSLRALIFYALISFFAITITCTSLVLVPFPFIVRYRYITAWSHIATWAVKILCGVRYTVHGLENIPKNSACVVLCKHQSSWETFALQVILPPQCWILKKKFLYVPFFGWGLAMLRPIAIPHKHPKSFNFVISKGIKRIQQGLFLIVFPEGTRTPYGQKGKYARSGALIAEKVGCDVLPVAHNAGKYWRRHGFIKYPGTIEVYIGKPIPVPPHSADKVIQQVEAWIEDHVR